MEKEIKNLKHQPVVSIITVVYNGVQYIERAIQSVIKQTYPNIEYIIIDGGSTDGTLDIIKKYQTDIAFWISEKDDGIYYGLNKGIAHTSGDLVGIIHSDDWYEPDAVEIVVENYLKHPQSDVFYGLLKFWSRDRKLLAIQGYTDDYLIHGMISHPTCFVKKNLYEKSGMFNTDFKIAADYNLMLGFKLKGIKFFFIEKLLANFSEGGASTTHLLKIRLEILKIKRNFGLVSPKKYILNFVYLWLKFKLTSGKSN